MKRRNFLAFGVAALATAKAQTPRSPFGIATTCYLTAWKPKDTLEFLEHARELGAAGIQSAVTSPDPAYAREIRSRCERYGMYFEAMVSLPRPGAAAAFEAQLRQAAEAGAVAMRTQCLGSRRYETYHDLASFERFRAASIAAIEQAAPLVDRARLPLAIENHKDWTAAELAGLMKRYSSEYLGVCLDFGNNLALLDDPMDVIETLAPYAFATHVKDMSVEPDPQGFLLSEVNFGEGVLDLARMIARVQAARPKTRMTVEMITRDPLKVPCLTDDYWSTFPERSGRPLARTLALVGKVSRTKRDLPRVSGQSPAALRRLENENVRNCLQYARTHFSQNV